MTWSIRLPFIRITAMPLEAVAEKTLIWEQITDRIKLMRYVLMVILGASRSIIIPAKE